MQKLPVHVRAELGPSLKRAGHLLTLKKTGLAYAWKRIRKVSMTVSKCPLTQHVPRSPHAGCLYLSRDSMTDTARYLWHRKADPLLGVKHFLGWRGRTRRAQFEQGLFSLILCLLFLYSVSQILLLKKMLMTPQEKCSRSYFEKVICESQGESASFGGEGAPS